MADPVVGITNGVPTSGTGTITTLGQTLLDGANATIGITTGAAVTTSAAGTLQQYLRGIVSLLVSGITVASHAVTNAGTFAVQAAQSGSWVLSAGAALIGKVGIDQTTPGTTNAISVAQIGSTTVATGSGVMTAGVQRMALATDSPGVIATAAPGTLSASGPSVTAVNPSNYETVAASQTAQAMGATGATGDFINGLLVIPATTSPGNVLLLDNATSITVFTGGATSVSNLVPFFVPLGMTSVSGAWKITTGANVSAIGVGKFT